jgi:hypothetical protein
MLAAIAAVDLLIERLINREMRARLDAVLSVAAELAQNAPDSGRSGSRGVCGPARRGPVGHRAADSGSL